MIKFIDLYAGIGGFRLVFEDLGAKCVFSSEWDKFAQQTYQANFGEVPHGDITKIDVKEIPDFDILCAGFPCQPFSQAGLKKGFQDERGYAFNEILRIAKYHLPKCIFLENVKSLATHDKGNTLKYIINSLESLHYTVFYKVLNAKDFGLPQNRARIFIVAFRGIDEFKWPNNIYSTPSLADILEGDGDFEDKYYLTNKQWSYHKVRKEKHSKKGNGFGYKLLNIETPYTPTLTAHYHKDGSEILIEEDNKNPRRLTPRECARLQGFPENFKILVSDGQAYKQFGNSIAVPVVKAIATKIIINLLN